MDACTCVGGWERKRRSAARAAPKRGGKGGVRKHGCIRPLCGPHPYSPAPLRPSVCGKTCKHDMAATLGRCAHIPRGGGAKLKDIRVEHPKGLLARRCVDPRVIVEANPEENVIGENEGQRLESVPGTRGPRAYPESRDRSRGGPSAETAVCRHPPVLQPRTKLGAAALVSPLRCGVCHVTVHCREQSGRTTRSIRELAPSQPGLVTP